MNRPIGIVLSVGIVLGLSTKAPAQSVVDWPPATGHMQFVPPVLPAPGAVGAQYVETFPSFTGMVEPQIAGKAQGGVSSYNDAPRSAAPARARKHRARGARTHNQGASLPPVPYNTSLPVGQLYWPGSAMSPAYTPASRYESLESGYGRSPYGSNFYGGYYKGFPITGLPIYGE
jgi:hypothetical protein